MYRLKSSLVEGNHIAEWYPVNIVSRKSNITFEKYYNAACVQN